MNLSKKSLSICFRSDFFAHREVYTKKLKKVLGGVNMSELEKGDNKQTVFKVEEHTPGESPKIGGEIKTSGLDQNVAGLLCYLGGFITGIIFLIIEKENRFVRFHAMQSIFTFAAIFVISMVINVIPLLGLLVSILLAPLSMILWIVLMVKAYQGKWFKLPFVGELAEKQLK